MNANNKGAVGELIACAFLLENGYSVFRNVSPDGPIDVVAIKDGIVYKFDIKSRSSVKRATKLQQDLGVKLIIVQNGVCEIKDFLPTSLEHTMCDNCLIVFVPRKEGQRFCQPRCCHEAYEDRRRASAARKGSTAALGAP